MTIPTVLLLVPFLVVWIGLWLLAFDWIWRRFVEPRVERHYAHKNGWPEDWLRKARKPS